MTCKFCAIRFEASRIGMREGDQYRSLSNIQLERDEIMEDCPPRCTCDEEAEERARRTKEELAKGLSSLVSDYRRCKRHGNHKLAYDILMKIFEKIRDLDLEHNLVLPPS